MEVSNLAGFQTEDFMPPVNELKARVDFIYQDDLIETNLSRSGKMSASDGTGNRKSFVGRAPGYARSGRPNRFPLRLPEVKLREIYDRVQDILKDKSYELKKTEQDRKTR